MDNQPASKPTLYDLFEATSLQNCQRLLDAGEIPTSGQLADILEANADQQLPAWFIDLVTKNLRGELKRKAGRRKEPALFFYRLAAAAEDYQSLLRELQEQELTSQSKSLSRIGGKNGSSEPPHERAANITIQRWRLAMSWRAFLNRIAQNRPPSARRRSG
ncbi:hypothetical protein WDM22_16190 [Bradyrhizobium septentrionale]|uniref:hypothetical protein n=1 Tax=Bradyrhizobium septentrionale TaxID=1404411 RepID=UPI0030CE9431